MSLFDIGGSDESGEADGADADGTLETEPRDGRTVRPGGGDPLEQAVAAVGGGVGDVGVLGGDDHAAELDVGAADLDGAYPAGAGTDAAARQARTLATVLQRDDESARADRVAEVAREQAGAGLSASAYVGSYAGALEAMVDRAFDEVEAGADPDEARAGLLAGVRAAMVDAQVGVRQFEADAGSAAGGDAGSRAVGMTELFEAIPYPAFLVDDEHTVLEYNLGLRRVLSLGDDHREFLGKDNRDTIAAATYTDDRRHRSLVDKVAENPRDADQHWEIDRVDDGMAYTEQVVYEDTSLTKDPEGNETHIRFHAVPLFDDDGDLKAVLELVEDRTEEIHHEKTVSELIGEVTETLRAIGDGDLSARARYEDEYGVVNPALLNLTDEVNEMATDFQGLVRRVDETTAELSASIDRATDAADRISDQVDSQTTATDEAASRVEEFSASMEEVATTANEVAAAADAALAEADRGREAGADARAVMEELTALSDDLVETVEELDRYMDEVGEVAEVMSEVAKQTNLLALNANIEAARVDQSGEGFAVVADEVKSLATQAQEHTDEITERIDLIRSHAGDTVAEVERSYDYVQRAGEEIEDTVDALETVSGEIEDVAVSIQEVAEANDRQAENVQEVMAQLDALRDSSEEVAETTADIVDVADSQQRIVEELSDRVHELSTDGA